MHDRKKAVLDRRHRSALAILVAVTVGAASADAAELTVDRAKTYQTIEGFGFFGGADVWWSSASAVLDQTWTQKVIDDLGITMWRNEYYAAGTPQDATWEKQKPVVQALSTYAAQKGVKLKILLTAWSPPAALKCISTDKVTCSTNPPARPADTKGGNILDPAMRADLAAWLVAGAQLYHDAGADLYAISFQNEPLFKEDYNSCIYDQAAYAATLAVVGPAIKAAFPAVKVFGAENMLGTECGKSPGTAFDSYWYTGNILKSTGALAAIDAFAVHGYVDGVSATATSKMASMWTSFRTGTATSGKAIWMTETSGYAHSWPGTSAKPGSLDLAQAIYAGLAYGNMSAWTYWQGSDKEGYSEYSLMAGATSIGKNYYVAKQFYRFIRPGAQRVDVQSSDSEVMVVAFQHAGLNSFTIVAINTGSTSKPLSLSGSGLPVDFHAFRTSASEDTVDLGTVAATGLTLSASSITTFVNGSYRESEGSTGTGGASGNGGASGTGGRPGSGGAVGSGTSATGGKGSAGGAATMGGAAGAGGTNAIHTGPGGSGGTTSTNKSASSGCSIIRGDGHAFFALVLAAAAITGLRSRMRGRRRR